MITKLMEELNCDRLFFENLVSRCDMHTESGRKTYNAICDALDYMDKKRGFWQQSKPLYVRCWEVEGKNGPKIGDDDKMRQASDGQIRFIENEIEKMSYDLNNSKPTDCLQRGFRLLETTKDSNLSSNIINELLSTVHSFIGLSYFDLKQFNGALKHHQKDLELSTQINHKKNTSRAMDNLGQVYARMKKYKKAIQIFGSKEGYRKTPLEAAWLYHEMGRCYLELDKYEIALTYARKSVGAAIKCNDLSWNMYSAILVGECEVCLGRLEKALESFRIAFDCAYRIGNQKSIVLIRNAIRKIQKQIEFEADINNSKIDKIQPKKKSLIRNGKFTEYDEMQKLSEITFDIIFVILEKFFKEFYLIRKERNVIKTDIVKEMTNYIQQVAQFRNEYRKHKFFSDIASSLGEFIRKYAQDLLQKGSGKLLDNIFGIITGIINDIKDLQPTDERNSKQLKKLALETISLALQYATQSINTNRKQDICNKIYKIILSYGKPGSRPMYTKSLGTAEYNDCINSTAKDIVDEIFREVTGTLHDSNILDLILHCFNILSDILKNIVKQMEDAYDPIVLQMEENPGSSDLAKILLLKIAKNTFTWKITDDIPSNTKQCLEKISKSVIDDLPEIVNQIITSSDAETYSLISQEVARNIAEFLLKDVCTNLSKADKKTKNSNDQICLIKEFYKTVIMRMVNELFNCLEIESDNVHAEIYRDLSFRILHEMDKCLCSIKAFCGLDDNDYREIIIDIISDTLQEVLKVAKEDSAKGVPVSVAKHGILLQDISSAILHSLLDRVRQEFFEDDKSNVESVQKLCQDIVFKVLLQSARKLGKLSEADDKSQEFKIHSSLKRTLILWKKSIKQELSTCSKDVEQLLLGEKEQISKIKPMDDVIKRKKSDITKRKQSVEKSNVHLKKKLSKENFEGQKIRMSTDKVIKDYKGHMAPPFAKSKEKKSPEKRVSIKEKDNRKSKEVHKTKSPEEKKERHASGHSVGSTRISKSASKSDPNLKKDENLKKETKLEDSENFKLSHHDLSKEEIKQTEDKQETSLAELFKKGSDESRKFKMSDVDKPGLELEMEEMAYLKDIGKRVSIKSSHSSRTLAEKRNSGTDEGAARTSKIEATDLNTAHSLSTKKSARGILSPELDQVTSSPSKIKDKAGSLDETKSKTPTIYKIESNVYPNEIELTIKQENLAELSKKHETPVKRFKQTAKTIIKQIETKKHDEINLQREKSISSGKRSKKLSKSPIKLSIDKSEKKSDSKKTYTCSPKSLIKENDKLSSSKKDGRKSSTRTEHSKKISLKDTIETMDKKSSKNLSLQISKQEEGASSNRSPESIKHAESTISPSGKSPKSNKNEVPLKIIKSKPSSEQLKLLSSVKPIEETGTGLTDQNILISTEQSPFWEMRTSDFNTPEEITSTASSSENVNHSKINYPIESVKALDEQPINESQNSDDPQFELSKSPREPLDPKINQKTPSRTSIEESNKSLSNKSRDYLQTSFRDSPVDSNQQSTERHISEEKHTKESSVDHSKGVEEYTGILSSGSGRAWSKFSEEASSTTKDQIGSLPSQCSSPKYSVKEINETSEKDIKLHSIKEVVKDSEPAASKKDEDMMVVPYENIESLKQDATQSSVDREFVKSIKEVESSQQKAELKSDGHETYSTDLDNVNRKVIPSPNIKLSSNSKTTTEENIETQSKKSLATESAIDTSPRPSLASITVTREEYKQSIKTSSVDSGEIIESPLVLKKKSPIDISEELRLERSSRTSPIQFTTEIDTVEEEKDLNKHLNQSEKINTSGHLNKKGLKKKGNSDEDRISDIPKSTGMSKEKKKRKLGSAKAVWLQKIAKVESNNDGAICARGALGRKSNLKKKPEIEIHSDSNNLTPDISDISKTSTSKRPVQNSKVLDIKKEAKITTQYKTFPGMSKADELKDSCERVGRKLLERKRIYDRYAESETGSERTADVVENFQCNNETDYFNSEILKFDSSSSYILSKKINILGANSAASRTNITYPSKNTSLISIAGSDSGLNQGGLSVKYTAGQVIGSNSSANTTQSDCTDGRKQVIKLGPTVDDSSSDTSCSCLYDKYSDETFNTDLIEDEALFTSSDSNYDYSSSNNPIFRCYELHSLHDSSEKSITRNLSETSENTPYDNLFV
ncbi:DgyrCDS3640 [Dimorphilus gyrociliatus]|uniref:Outer dynein arm-docking complex subunit 4 n=1 Tax=Dimorphilus gyrociliatus TaxID=2664684 RepID=A0A7I8VEB3_9ANNE|nr:DgyrCDS3640 [Dimorphilus gyrociliatus]